MRNQDKETKEYFDENKAVYDFVKSDGWIFVRDKLLKQVEDLQSIMNLDGTQTPEQIVTELKVRRITVEELVKFLKKVEGQADQFEGNLGSYSETKPNHVIRG